MQSLNFLFQIAEGFFRYQHPSLLVYFVSSRCNCRCSFCFNQESVSSADCPPELSLGEITKVAKSSHPLPQILLSGGEPFLREDIAEIVRLFYLYASTRQVSIPTNGSLSDFTVKSVERILKECPDVFLNINLSLDGIGHDHDELRGLSGCFERLCQTYKGLEALRKHHKRLSINVLTIITGRNADKIESIHDYVKKNLDVNYHFMSLVRGSVDASEKNFDMNLAESKIEAIYGKRTGINKMPLFNCGASAVTRLLWDILKRGRREKKRLFDCRAGQKMIVLDHQGDLYPCEPLWLDRDVRNGKKTSEFRMARLQEYDFDVSRALKSPQAVAVKRFVNERKCSCAYGCAVTNSIVYSPKMHLKLLKEMISCQCCLN